MIFVDASAIVAMLSGEAGFEKLADRLRACQDPITSAVAVYEAVLAVARQKASLQEADNIVWQFVFLARMEIVPIDERTARSALTAFQRYGKGRGHPAQLNMGDCFAYACARTHDVPLLFVGNDFAQTDIRSAMT